MSIDRYLELAARVDQHFARVHERHAGAMDCGSGCSECCVRFSVTLVEAAVVAQGVFDAEPAARQAMAARAAEPGTACPALDDAGRCRIYAYRPLICRSHGAPIRQRSPGSLPVIDVCPRNFKAGLDAVDDGDVFDQATVSTVLGAIDAAFADACGAPRGTRIEVTDLLADPERYFAADDEGE